MTKKSKARLQTIVFILNIAIQVGATGLYLWDRWDTPVWLACLLAPVVVIALWIVFVGSAWAIAYLLLKARGRL